MSMSEHHRRILEKCAPDLLNDLQAKDVIPYLVADGVLTRNDVEIIESKATTRDRVSALLEIIPRRGAAAYTSFKTSLTKSEGIMHLYDSMNFLEQEAQYETSADLPLSQECTTDSISVDVHMRDASCLDTSTVEGIDSHQPANPTKPLKDIHFLELAKGLGQYWETLAVHLGITRAQVFQCKENNKYNSQQQICDMLSKWKGKNGKRATVTALLEACKKIDDLDEDVYHFLYDV